MSDDRQHPVPPEPQQSAQPESQDAQYSQQWPPPSSSSPAPSSEPGAHAAGTPAALPGTPVTELAAKLSDGEWHRLHPASPLLKGGIFLIAVIAFVLSNLRERLIEMFMPSGGYGGQDPLEIILESGLLGWALLALLVVLLVIVTAFYISWRMHTFRITDEVVEVRSGVLFRTNRRARLDRIQGINIVRPFFARLFGAARVEINQAGQDANVKLDYLGSAAADDLRREILRLASGSRIVSAPAAAGGDGQSVIDRRVNEFLAPELDPDAAPPESIVKLGIGRLIGSIVLSGATVFLIVGGIAVIGSSIWAPQALFGLFGLIPAAIGIIGFYVSRFTKSLRYSIAGTPDGVRVGFGLLSTSNETIPPGRIHSVKVSQPLLWRKAGWWEIRVNLASRSSANGASGQQNTTILPVGNVDDVMRVLELVLPSMGHQRVDALPGAVVSGAAAGDGPESPSIDKLAVRGMLGLGEPDDGFVNSPRRAAPLRWFSWRRNGFAITPDVVLLRRGAIWRELIIVPHARLQSVSLNQGPVLRPMRLASVYLHTVAGPITARLGAIDRDAAVSFFESVADVAVRASNADTSHRWRSGDRA